VLRELIERPDTPLDPAVKTRILAQLDQAEQRFTTILHACNVAGIGTESW
jgi:hypothetical protein